ncbi:MAG: FecCD family ABC transporter permease [Tuberibacillus sp.]
MRRHTHPQSNSRPLVATIAMVGGLILLVLGLSLSISVGAADIKLSTVWDALFQYQSTNNSHRVIMDIRLPRTLGAAMVGASLAVAGAIMQGMSLNPLADSGILGLNAGAGLALALCFAFMPKLPFIELIFFCFLGTGLGALLVFGFGSMAKGGLTPIKLTLAGAAVSALLTALSEGVGLYFHLSQDLAFWMLGGVAGTNWTQIKILFPFVFIGIIVSLMLSRSISLLSLGDSVAKGLGQRTVLVKVLSLLVVLVLAGSAVSVVGSIAFIGLIIPHVARFLVGASYSWIIPCSAVFGAVLMVFADMGARLVNPPYETPVGALIAIIGAPFFLYLARGKKVGL